PNWTGMIGGGVATLATDGNVYDSNNEKVVGTLEGDLASYTWLHVDTLVVNCASLNRVFTLTASATSCQKVPGTGNGATGGALHSVQVDVGLGKSTNYEDSVKLMLYVEVPSGNMATPGLLKVLPTASV